MPTEGEGDKEGDKEGEEDREGEEGYFSHYFLIDIFIVCSIRISIAADKLQSIGICFR